MLEHEARKSSTPPRLSQDYCLEPLVSGFGGSDAEALWPSRHRSLAQRPVLRRVLLAATAAVLLGTSLYASAVLGFPRPLALVTSAIPGRASQHSASEVVDLFQDIRKFRIRNYHMEGDANKAERDQLVALHAEVAHLQILLGRADRLAEVADLQADIVRLKSMLLEEGRAGVADDAGNQSKHRGEQVLGLKHARGGHREAAASKTPAPTSAPTPAPTPHSTLPPTLGQRKSNMSTAGAAGWYDGGEDQSCEVGCAAQNLRCSEKAFAAENSVVAQSDKVLRLIKSVGGQTVATACDDQFGESPDVPLWSNTFCFSSKAARAAPTFDCGVVPMPFGEGKHRLCFCVADEAKTAAGEHASAGTCAATNQNCTASRCCQIAGQVCFEKDPGWAVCSYDCIPDIHLRDPLKYQTPWSCDILAPPHTPKYPTLFCFLAMQSSGMELDVVQHQVQIKAGIFSCQAYEVFSDKVMSLGSDVRTLKLNQFAARSGVQGALTATWVNTNAFIEAWEAVMSNVRMWRCEWVVKVDPDAVFFPARLRVLLRDLQHEVQEQDTDKGAYLRNCNADNLQLYGSMEVVSRNALYRFRHHVSECSSADVKRMGEDMWMQQCLDKIGAAGIDAWNILDDKYCPATNTHPQPCRFGAAAFHPYKAKEQWSQCWDLARLPP